MSHHRPCLPIRVIPWIITANARMKEGVKEGETRPIHSYSRLGQRLPGLMEKDGSIKVPRAAGLHRRFTHTLPAPLNRETEPEEERPVAINLSAYISETEASPVQVSHMQIMRRRHRTYVKKQLKRGLSTSFSKSNLEESFSAQPASSLYIFTGAELPKRSPSACSLMQNLAAVRKRLSLGYTQSTDIPKSPPISPRPKSIFAKGRQVRLRPKAKRR